MGPMSPMEPMGPMGPVVPGGPMGPWGPMFPVVLGAMAAMEPRMESSSHGMRSNFHRNSDDGQLVMIPARLELYSVDLHAS